MNPILHAIFIAWFLWFFDGATYVPRLPAISSLGPSGEILTDVEQQEVCLHAVAILRRRYGISAFCAPNASPTEFNAPRGTMITDD